MFLAIDNKVQNLVQDQSLSHDSVYYSEIFSLSSVGIKVSEILQGLVQDEVDLQQLDIQITDPRLSMNTNTDLLHKALELTICDLNNEDRVKESGKLQLVLDYVISQNLSTITVSEALETQNTFKQLLQQAKEMKYITVGNVFNGGESEHRIFNALRRGNIESIVDFLYIYNNVDLLKIKGLGAKSIPALEEKLNEYKIPLGGIIKNIPAFVNISIPLRMELLRFKNYEICSKYDLINLSRKELVDFFSQTSTVRAGEILICLSNLHNDAAIKVVKYCRNNHKIGRVLTNHEAMEALSGGEL